MADPARGGRHPEVGDSACYLFYSNAAYTYSVFISRWQIQRGVVVIPKSVIPLVIYSIAMPRTPISVYISRWQIQRGVVVIPKSAISLVNYSMAMPRTPISVFISRWQIQRGVVVIPKSVTPARIEENADVFGFSLTEVKKYSTSSYKGLRSFVTFHFFSWYCELFSLHALSTKKVFL
jgi:diketogulonate reductase-like aldo/keto reductase